VRRSRTAVSCLIRLRDLRRELDRIITRAHQPDTKDGEAAPLWTESIAQDTYSTFDYHTCAQDENGTMSRQKKLASHVAAEILNKANHLKYQQAISACATKP